MGDPLAPPTTLCWAYCQSVVYTGDRTALRAMASCVGAHPLVQGFAVLGDVTPAPQGTVAVEFTVLLTKQARLRSTARELQGVIISSLSLAGGGGAGLGMPRVVLRQLARDMVEEARRATATAGGFDEDESESDTAVAAFVEAPPPTPLPPPTAPRAGADWLPSIAPGSALDGTARLTEWRGYVFTVLYHARMLWMPDIDSGRMEWRPATPAPPSDLLCEAVQTTALSAEGVLNAAAVRIIMSVNDDRFSHLAVHVQTRGHPSHKSMDAFIDFMTRRLPTFGLTCRVSRREIRGRRNRVVGQDGVRPAWPVALRRRGGRWMHVPVLRWGPANFAFDTTPVPAPLLEGRVPGSTRALLTPELRSGIRKLEEERLERETLIRSNHK